MLLRCEDVLCCQLKVLQPFFLGRIHLCWLRQGGADVHTADLNRGVSFNVAHGFYRGQRQAPVSWKIGVFTLYRPLFSWPRVAREGDLRGPRAKPQAISLSINSNANLCLNFNIRAKND